MFIRIIVGIVGASWSMEKDRDLGMSNNVNNQKIIGISVVVNSWWINKCWLGAIATKYENITNIPPI